MIDLGPHPYRFASITEFASDADYQRHWQAQRPKIPEAPAGHNLLLARNGRVIATKKPKKPA